MVNLESPRWENKKVEENVQDISPLQLEIGKVNLLRALGSGAALGITQDGTVIVSAPTVFDPLWAPHTWRRTEGTTVL